MHVCPVCGCACSCGGDIDDILFDDPFEDFISCECDCWEDGECWRDDDDEGDDYSKDDDLGCWDSGGA